MPISPPWVGAYNVTEVTDVKEEKEMHEEDEKERRDRQLIELLNELRVALPGVQVLFAFLLIVPFSQRFSAVTP